jgi:undecaprenyl-diphosphatase
MLDAILAADGALLRRILDLPHPQWANWIGLAASRVGIAGVIWIVYGLVLFLRHRIGRAGLIRLLLAIVVVHLVVDYALKPWVDRSRPPVAMPDLEAIGAIPETRSFPSGHTAHAVAGALVLTALYPSAAAAWLTWLAAAVVGLARVYLGVHYPLDAFAGAIVGLCCGAAALRVPLPGQHHVQRAGD